MSELRAPDPTLVDLHEPVAVDQRAREPAVAHRLPSPGSAVTGCALSAIDKVNSRYAAYFAVPCRECFPDAPPPGYMVDSLGRLTNGQSTHLAWQVTS